MRITVATPWIIRCAPCAVWAAASLTALPANAHAPDLATQVHAYLSRLEGYGFSGAALVAKDGAILIQTAHGLAVQNGTPFRPDTIFDVGSITKQFTAAAILALESDGKLRIADTLAQHLPNLPPDKADITLHHLLTHTSGLPIDVGDDYEKVSRAEMIRRTTSSTLRNPPGQSHAYSNAGYSLLAAVVEIVSEKSYDAFLRERLFQPAGMTSSGYMLPPGEIAHRVARAYRDGTDINMAERAAATGGEMWNLIGNGGIHSTTGDLHRWIIALQQEKVLSKAALQKFFEPHVLVSANYQNSKSQLHYAYGWYVWKRPTGNTLIFHLGGNGAMNAAVRYHVDDRAVVIYASNVSEYHDPAYPVPVIERMLAGELVPVPPEVRPLTADQLARLEGRYRSPSGASLTLDVKEPCLRVLGEGQEAFTFSLTGRWHNDPVLDELNQSTLQAVEDSRTENYDALAKVFPPTMTTQQLRESEAAFWRKRYDAYGEYTSARVLGTTTPRGTRFAGPTIVAIEFSRGTVYREYLWNRERTIIDIGPLRGPPFGRLFPESAESFVMIDPATSEVSRIQFNTQMGEPIATIEQGQARIECKKE